MYHGQSASEIKSAFISTVDAYLELCRKKKREPNKPYKGSFNVRLTPELHKAAVELAAQRGITLNDFVFRTISDEVTEANEKQNTTHAWAQIATATGSSQTLISSNITQPDQQNMYGSQVANCH